MRIEFAGSLADLGIESEVSRWSESDLITRMWARDRSVWFDQPTEEITDRLGWLDLPQTSRADLESIAGLSETASFV